MKTSRPYKRCLIWISFLLLLIPDKLNAKDPNYIAAGTLRGEAPAACNECRIITACALVRDQTRGIVLSSRWYGWQKPSQVDIDLVQRARETALCSRYPTCKFVGNDRDLEVWARKGWISPTVEVKAYCSKHGCTVYVPEIERNYQEE